MLDVHMPARDAGTRRGDEDAEYAVRSRAGAARGMQRGHEKHETERNQRDALKDTERARFEIEHVLSIERISHQADDRDDADRVQPPALRARRDQGRVK